MKNVIFMVTTWFKDKYTYCLHRLYEMAIPLCFPLSVLSTHRLECLKCFVTFRRRPNVSVNIFVYFETLFPFLFLRFTSSSHFFQISYDQKSCRGKLWLINFFFCPIKWQTFLCPLLKMYGRYSVNVKKCERTEFRKVCKGFYVRILFAPRGYCV